MALSPGQTSLFDRFISKRRPVWVRLVVCLLLLSLPFGAAYLDGVWDAFLRQGQWRASLGAPTVILYIWLVAPLMARVEAQVVSALRPLTPLDDENFERLVSEAARTDPRHELVAIGLGVLLGIASALASGAGQQVAWLHVYWFVFNSFLYGLVIWTIYISVASTRLNAALHRQPLRFDILDPAPFEPLGRQSLLLALVFVGGISLSLVFAFQMENLYLSAFWLVYLGLALATILIFFMSLRPTHQLLAAAKKRALQPVQGHIRSACREMVGRLDRGQEVGSLAAEINALVAYEQRLLAARTWPHNTSMLRTLFFSVFIPLGSLLGRAVVEVLFQ